MKGENVETIKELAKEVLKKREVSEDKKEDKKEEEIKNIDEHREADGSLKEHTTQPLHIDCPYCDEGKKPRGIGGHIREKHGVPGVSVQEIFDLQKEENEKSLEEFTCEKLGNKEIEIKNIPTEILKREFPTWTIPGQEEDLEEVKEEEEEDEEDLEAEPEEDLEAEEKNPGNPELKENPKNEYEWTNPDLPFPFNLLRRKKVRGK